MAGYSGKWRKNVLSQAINRAVHAGLRPFLILFLVTMSIAGCQKGDSNAPRLQRPDPATAEIDGIWLGHRAVPLAAATALVEKETLPSITPSPSDSRHWQVNQGESVASALRRWSIAAGYTPLPNFSAKEEWTFIVTQEFSGDFEAALGWLSEGFQRQPIRPVAVLYANHTLDLVGQATQMADDQRDRSP